jgi:hypothetical protein
MNAAPSSSAFANDSHAAVIGSSALFASCCQCGTSLRPLHEVAPCHRSRIKCNKCKVTGSRERSRKYKQNNPEIIAKSRQKEQLKDRETRRKYAEENCKCTSCGVPLKVGESLNGWTQRKCKPCSDAAPSRQPVKKRESCRKTYWKHRDTWLARARQWKENNREWVAEYSKQWGNTRKIHTLSYAAQCLVRGTALEFKDIPTALRELKLLQLKLKRLIKTT